MKILFDIYHVQIMQGDIIARIRQFHEYIGHYHTAGVPGRHEMDDKPGDQLPGHHAGDRRRPATKATSARNSSPPATRMEKLREAVDAVRRVIVVIRPENNIAPREYTGGKMR